MSPPALLYLPLPHQRHTLATLQITILNVVTRSLPFPVSESDEPEPPREETRLRHRVLDLRRPAMARSLRMRHEMIKVSGAGKSRMWEK